LWRCFGLKLAAGYPMNKALIPIDASVLDNLGTGVLVFDDDLQFRYLNQVAESLLAISSRHAVGHFPDEQITCDGLTLANLIAGAVREGQSTTKRGVTLVTADRVSITVDCMINPVTDGQGDGYTIVELQQVDRQMRIRREKQLISQQAATRDLVRGLAHEIKNPLGGLRGAAQLLQAELPEPELEEYTQIIIQEADRLQELVNRMLGPNRRPDYRALNIHHVLERVRSLVLAEIGNDSVTIKQDYDVSIPELIGDVDQLIQAVLNIVKNAVRVMDGQGQIVLRTRVARNFTIGNDRHRLVAQIEIGDSGPGIPPEISETLFLPMVTSGDGQGLGLSIAQSLITQHKGLVECRSRPGDTVFTILLPLAGEQPTLRGTPT